MLLILGLSWLSHSLIRRVHNTWLRRSLYGLVGAMAGLTSWFALSVFVFYLQRAPLDGPDMMVHMASWALLLPM